MGWKAVDLILSESTRKKITLTGDLTDKQLKAMVDPSNLEKKYGGSADNVTEFWPPIFPSEEYGCNPDLVVSEEEYL